jgi:succinate dehydrogenase/fumarate reductase flavoprotein subunit
MKSRVIVLGSGAAGLSAAIAAASEGADVTVFEATPFLGGTTALSGGVAWIPCTQRARDAGYGDSREDALAYLRSYTDGDVAGDLLVAYVDEGPAMMERLEKRTPIRWMVMDYPDYHVDRPGGRAAGRSLEPHPIKVRPDVDPVLRKPLSWRLRMTHTEGILQSADPKVIADRVGQGIQTMGNALVAGLIEGAWDAGVTTRAGVRVRELRLENGRVTGVETDEGFVPGSVVIGTGGFERDEQLARSFLRAPISGSAGAPGARGDGLRMALSAGAQLGNMSEAWWAPIMRVPGDLIDGAPLWRFLHTERSRPGSIMVDQRGARFCNEAQNYNDVGRALHSFNPGEFTFDRDPCWLVFDESYRLTYPIGPVLPGEAVPDWWTTATTPEGLAGKLGIPAERFARTLELFNEDAALGRDSEFGRGQTVYDRFVGDHSAEHPNLRPLDSRPLYAVELRSGVLGTKGGAKTDSHGRVLHFRGEVIPGLYAAGNASANCFGLAYPGGGGTIGPALVFGDRAGTAAATD